MKYLIIALVALMTSLGASQHFSLFFTEEWKPTLQQHKENGKVFEIWEKECESVIIVAAPFKEEKETIDHLLDCMSCLGLDFEVNSRSENEVIFSWKVDDLTTLSRVMLTEDCFHSISYMKEGKLKAEDQDSWLTLLQEASLTD